MESIPIRGKPPRRDESNALMDERAYSWIIIHERSATHLLRVEYE